MFLLFKFQLDRFFYSLAAYFIYITTGLLRSASNTAEVAGVLGHEIGHIVERQLDFCLGHEPGLLAIAVQQVKFPLWIQDGQGDSGKTTARAKNRWS